MQLIYPSKDLNATFNTLATSMSNSIRSNSDNGTLSLAQSASLSTILTGRGSAFPLSVSVAAAASYLWRFSAQRPMISAYGSLARSLYLSLAHKRSVCSGRRHWRGDGEKGKCWTDISEWELCLLRRALGALYIPKIGGKIDKRRSRPSGNRK
jgi:hypothetical protein